MIKGKSNILPSPHQEGRAGPLASCSGWSTWTYPWPDPSLLTGAGLGISDPRGTVDPGEADGEDVVGGICREYWGLLAGSAAGKFKRFQRWTGPTLWLGSSWASSLSPPSPSSSISITVGTDGDILANKTVLFCCMLSSNNNFVESQAGSVNPRR